MEEEKEGEKEGEKEEEKDIDHSITIKENNGKMNIEPMNQKKKLMETETSIKRINGWIKKVINMKLITGKIKIAILIKTIDG